MRRRPLKKTRTTFWRVHVTWVDGFIKLSAGEGVRALEDAKREFEARFGREYKITDVKWSVDEGLEAVRVDITGTRL